MKTIVMLATFHQWQMSGSPKSPELKQRVSYLASKFGTELVMEEWSENQGISATRQDAPSLGLKWANVGTPREERFRTYVGPIHHPGHDSDSRDEYAPSMERNGPFENQEARENQMVSSTIDEMKAYQSGLLILGCAHLHSVFAKLRSSGFNVKAFSWLG